jgi:HSP20 family protein
MPGSTDEFFGKDLLQDFFATTTNYNMPAVNITESKDDFKINVAAPGLSKEDFKIDLHNKILTLSSEKEEKNEEANEKFTRREFSYSSFKRSFGLPELVDTDNINATYKDGILMIEIPKREEAKEKPARQITIS